jgi:hypothetical protein
VRLLLLPPVSAPAGFPLPPYRSPLALARKPGYLPLSAYDRSAPQKEVRSLAALGDTAATSRVLNLGQIFKVSGTDPDYRRRPFFQNGQLNKAIILKHTVRQNEKYLFNRAQRTATKVILPFDSGDLKLGGQSILVGQNGFETFLRQIFNSKDLAGH